MNGNTCYCGRPASKPHPADAFAVICPICEQERERQLWLYKASLIVDEPTEEICFESDLPFHECNCKACIEDRAGHPGAPTLY